MKKQFAANQGVVAGANLGTIFQREIFFPVDPATLDWMDYDEVRELFPSSMYVDLDITQYMKFLPEEEAEIFWLNFVKKKHQKDIAELMGFSQPSVSYRYRRVLVKLKYLMILDGVPLRKYVADLDFLNEQEREILIDLFYFLNQEKVGKKHNVRQSTVKWVFTKTKRKLIEYERKDNEKWFNYLGLMYLVDHFFLIRVII